MMKRCYTMALLLVSFFAAKAQVAFKGGNNALTDFLTGHIVYPEFSRTNCIGATVQVSFKVDKSGKVFDAAVKSGPGIDLDDEALRVIKMTSGHWDVPPDYNTGNTVVLPINFTPDYSRCNSAATTGGAFVNTGAAIAAYRNRQQLEDAVTNYYKNKYAGKADASKEPDIQRLKDQLGFNDEFINDVLNQASDKLKQGDKEGACQDWNFIRNIGSDKADTYLAKYCK